MLIDVECLPNELFQIIDLLVALERETVEYAALRGVKGHPEELLLYKLDLRDW